MMTRIACVLAVIAALLGLYHFRFSPEAVYSREVQKAFDEFSKTVETQNPAQIKTALGNLINEFAHISLEVHFPMPGKPQKAPPAETFGKTEFLDFINNIIYSVDNYHIKANVDDLKLIWKKEPGSVHVTFTVDSKAHGISGVMAEMGAQFSVPTNCKAELFLDEKSRPSIRELTCVAQIQRSH